MNNITYTLVKNTLKNKMILTLLILLYAFLFFSASSFSHNNKGFFWNLYLLSGGEPDTSFIIFPFFFIITGKLYVDIIKNKEFIHRLKSKKRLLDIILLSNFIACFFITLSIVLISILCAAVFTRTFKESVLIPGILVSDYIMLIVNFIRSFLMIITLTSIEIYLLNRFSNKKISILILMIIDFCIGFSIFLVLPSHIEKLMPASFIYDNHLYRNLLECVISSVIYYALNNYLIFKLNYKLINKVDFNFTNE